MSEIPRALQEALQERYEILRELGRGGMAIVYAARDLKLDREVAIKVLLPDLAMAMGPERFAREISVTSHLSHPHILAVYDSGNVNGQLYYVMPLVRGESLRARLDREKQMPLDEALRLSIEVARALEYAHRQGVVHRDIKPENILLDDGSAIVADFGIARAISSMAENQPLTQSGMSLGTAAYMSPEQITAEKDIDGRSDVYSLACVTYEMLAGQPPFTGPNAVAVMARHAMEMPPSLKVVRQTIPDEVEEVVFQALAKTRVDRFDSAAAYADALEDCLEFVPRVRRPTPVRATQATMARRRARRRRKSFLVAGLSAVALAALVTVWRLAAGSARPATAAGEGLLDPTALGVLYFTDLSRDSSLAHVADAFTEGLIAELGTVNGLNVVSRNATAPFRGQSIAADSVARVLGTGTLIQGSVEPVGDRLRVTTWLIDGNSGADRDRSTFTIPAVQLLGARDSVVREAASLLRRRLGSDIRVRETQTGTANVDAWSYVQRAERLRKEGLAARDAGRSASADSTYRRADSLLVTASSLDERWAEPHALRGQIAYERAQLRENAQRRNELLDESASHASRALELQPENARALSLRGRARHVKYILAAAPDPAARERLLDSAKADLESATQRDPNQAEAFLALSRLHYDRKDNVSALLAARRAYEADAFLRQQDQNLRQLFWTHYDLEQFPDADRWCREGARRFPEHHAFAECQLWMQVTPWAQPDPARAWQLAATATRLAPHAQQAYERHYTSLIVAGVLARAGMADSARKVLESARAPREVDPSQELDGYAAVMYTLLGDYDRAIELLSQYVARHPTHEFSVGRDLHWWWRPLRDKPGFAALLARRQH